MKKKKIILDVAMNIIATSIPTVVLQLIILPALAQEMSDSKYGLLVTILALLNMVPSTMGNVLNNIRLLYENEYLKHNYIGDYNIILLIFSVINLTAVAIASYAYERAITALSILLTLGVSISWLFREYYIVAFRLQINYFAILINNILLVVGYGLGYVVFRLTGYWQFIYIIGYLISLGHIFKCCELWKEPLTVTPMFKKTTWQSILLLISNFLSRILTYADKLLVYPILGGAVVSVYYAATVFGKVVALMITPITSVALTYLSKMSKKADNLFKSTFIFGTIICAIGYVFCVLISKPVLQILYPQYVDDAMHYILITTATTVLYAMISIVNPFILKFYDMNWQIIINGITVLIYLVLCLILLHFWGLYGFCIGALLTNLCKLVLMLYIYCRRKSSSSTVLNT